MPDDRPKVLHPPWCKSSEQNLASMRRLLARDWEALERIDVTPFEDAEEASTPLIRAVRSKHLKCVRFLLEAGAKANTCDREGRSALRFAITAGPDDILELLLQHGASPECDDVSAGNRCRNLAVACMMGYTGKVRLLLEHGALTEDLQATGRSDCFPTFPPAVTAAQRGQYECLKMTLLYGAITNLECFPNLPQDSGRDLYLVPYNVTISPGSNAAKLKMLRLLHYLGIDLTEKNSERRTLLQSVRSCVRFEPQFAGLADGLQELLCSKPLSLKEISRINIRRVMGSQYLKNIHKLEVPIQLHEFLKFLDF